MNPIQGWLDKKSIFGLWSRRYISLSLCKLSIYRDNSCSYLESEFELDSQTIIETNSSNNYQFKVKIQNSKPITLYLRAHTTKNMIDWVFQLRRAAYSNRSVNINMFDVISLQESGLYGKIMLCSKKDSGEIVLIKSIKKAKLTKAKKISSVFNEKLILSTVHNPFIINLKYAFQNTKYYYLAMEYAPGGNLFHRLKSSKISINDIKLYIAELTIALHELHTNHIIYRDMKPENVVIMRDGHLKLIDFGLSTFSEDNQPKTTFCGTAEFIAPEVILGQGYDERIDWWGLGILTYELLYKTTPFFGMNIQYIYQSILKKDPVFPKNEEKSIVSFVSSLLEKDPSKRGGYQFIIDSEFLIDFDFNSVFEKKISPSFLPNVKDFVDVEQRFACKKSSSSDSDSDNQQQRVENRVDDFSYNYIHDYL